MSSKGRKHVQSSSSGNMCCEIVYKDRGCPLNEHLGNNPNTSQTTVFKSTTDVWYWIVQPNMCFSLRWYAVVPPRHLNWYDLKYFGSMSPGQKSEVWFPAYWGEWIICPWAWPITPQASHFSQRWSKSEIQMFVWQMWQNIKMSTTVMFMKSADNSKTGLRFVWTGMLRNKLFLYHPSISGLLGPFQPGEKLRWQVGQLKKQTS